MPSAFQPETRPASLLDCFLDCLLYRFIILTIQENVYTKEEMKGTQETMKIISVSELAEMCAKRVLANSSQQ